MTRYKKDWIIAVGVVMTLAAIYGSLVWSQKSRLTEIAVINELRSIRLAVAAFYYVNGRSPVDLQELADSAYTAQDGSQKHYLPRNVIERRLKDPNGRPYEYDPQTGWVKSQSEKFINW